MAENSEYDEKRRSFLVKLSFGLSGFAALAASVPIFSAIFAPLIEKTPKVWRTVGKLDDFTVNETKLVTFKNADPKSWSGVTSDSAAWLRRDDIKSFTAFAANCTHLGCPVRWEQDAELFMCPCHGGVYYKNGTVAAGPPPKALVHYPVRISKGEVQILTSPVPITNMSA